METITITAADVETAYKQRQIIAWRDEPYAKRLEVVAEFLKNRLLRNVIGQREWCVMPKDLAAHIKFMEDFATYGPLALPYAFTIGTFDEWQAAQATSTAAPNN